MLTECRWRFVICLFSGGHLSTSSNMFSAPMAAMTDLPLFLDSLIVYSLSESVFTGFGYIGLSESDILGGSCRRRC